MEVIEVEIYTFEELESEAKEKARAWYRDGLEYPWFSESIDSIRAFCKHFGVNLMDWEIMPTGYCLDCDLWYEFHDQFKRTGDAKYSFDQALEAAICAINRDIEYQFSDEAVDESLIANEYRFTNEGKFFN
jgi:hypothetical protein